MKIEAFKILHDMEESWWYKGRRMIASKLLSKFLKDRNLGILDFGSGYGGMHDFLKEYGTVDGFEVETDAIISCQKRGYHKVYSSTSEFFNGDKKYDLVVMFDVLEHIEDDKATINALCSILNKNKTLVITVPAFMWLWGIHDEQHKHFRRYNRKQIVDLLNSGGFQVEYSSYWNMFLFVPAAVVRLLGFSGTSSFNQSRISNSIFTFVIFLETKLIPIFTLPFGTGIVIVARKK
jgi:2-polyprenyl-3-methyl-5-hydroxy-6-metoxy-1,4-benzoquinol methylase